MDASILEAIGSPLVQVESPPGSTIAAKIEAKNPGGSAKDRPALAMVEAAEERGELEPGDRLVEPTSGNTGIGLAVAAAAKDYDLTVVMPESKSPERRAIIRAYGADIELVEGDISDAKDRADELEDQGAVQLRQFENPANPRAHYATTGAEILEQVGERTVDALVVGVGTGGTITGIGRRLREAFPDVEIVAVEPASNPVIAAELGIEIPGESSGEDDYQGMGPGFVSENTDLSLIDDVEIVDVEDAESECRRLAREEGILVGQSSGASCLGSKRVARRLVEERDATADGNADGDDELLVITVFWDSGERYLSTGMFDGE
jgi:cysteine synthase A